MSDVPMHLSFNRRSSWEDHFYGLDSYPLEPYPSEPYPLEPYPWEIYPLEPYPLEPYPLDSYPLDSYPLDSYRSAPYRLEQFRYREQSLDFIFTVLNAAKRADDKNKEAISQIGKDGFEVGLDEQQFKPSEVTMESIIFEGELEGRPDGHGFVGRQFARCYVLSEGCNAKVISSCGALIGNIAMPSKTESRERIVHIQHAGPAHLSVKEDAREGDKDEDQSKEGHE